MPADDLILNVRQIDGYPTALNAVVSDALILQRGGLGGPYLSISPTVLVATALAQGGDMAIGGKLSAQAFSGGSAQFSNAAVNLFSAQKACVVEFDATWGTISGKPIATQDFVAASTVRSFNRRAGDVTLWLTDILNAGGAPNFSPVFGGEPRAPTPAANSNNSRLATTLFVQRNFVEGINHFLADHPFVFTFNGRTGDVVLTAQDIIDAGGSGEIFDSPAFTGIPTAPTAAPGTNTNQVATCAFVMAAVGGGPFAPLNSPVFTGTPSGPTAAPGSTTGQFATTAFVMNAVADSVTGVASFNTRTGNVTLTGPDIAAAGGALTISPALTGIPTAPTATPGTNTTQLATTAYVTAALAAVSGGVTSFNSRTGAVSLTTADISAAGGAALASPVFTGTPSAPNAAPNTSTSQIATTQFVMSELANAAVQSFNGRTGVVTLTSADISAAGGAALQSPAFLGTPTAPTAAPGTNTGQLATTAYVQAALAGAGVSSFNGRTGAVTLTGADITGAGGAPLAAPAFSGVPTAPTAAPGNSSQQLATTAFVAAALAGGAGVSSFNTRTGAVTLTSADVTAAGGAPLGSPAFTGSPTAPTPTAGNSSTSLATTAFVQGAIATGAVTSFNGRTGSVTLNSSDISAAGGAVLASPAFTGTPTGPTATAGTNSGQLATTAFVMTALGAAGGVNSFNGRAGAVTLTGADITGAGGVLAGALPTGQVFTATGTYTPPAGVKRIRVRMVGGGGGGGGTVGGNQGGTGGTSSLLGWTALGGVGGQPGAASSTGGAGSAGGTGGANGTGNPIFRLQGGFGGSGQSLVGQQQGIGGTGGSTPFGMGAVVRQLVSSPVVNNGAGGAGAFSNNTTVGGAGGGGGGEYVEFYVNAPATGAATVGAGGALGTNGGSGVNGGAGSPGLIIVEEFYQ